MENASHNHQEKKRGRDGFPVIGRLDGEPEWGQGDTAWPAPPSYDEALMYSGSDVLGAGTSSSQHRPELSGTATRHSSSDVQPSSRTPHTPGPDSNQRSPRNSSSAVVSNPSIANERPHYPRHQPTPPHVLLPPAAPSNVGFGPNTEPCGRPPPQHLPYGPFPPAVLNAHSDDLARGFPLEPPACACAPGQQHPFVTHDVNEDDWARFLHDVRVAGPGLTPIDPMLADVAPRATKTGMLVGFVADMALRAVVKSKRKNPVADVITYWNQRFFHPRLMDVVLAQGAVTYTGPEGVLPPDMAHMSSDRTIDEDRTHDRGAGGSDSAFGRRGRPRLVGGIGGSFREMAGLGATDKRERVEFSRDVQASAREKWRLIVTYRPLTY